MGNVMQNLVAVAVAIVGLASLAVLVSSRAQTSQVISATASGFGSVIGAAVAPVTGASPGASQSGFNLININKPGYFA